MSVVAGHVAAAALSLRSALFLLLQNFRVGVGEVIRGWDVGVGSMQKGGKRAMLVPPEMGYGRRGSPPDIPGNSTLYFEVELM